MNKLLQFLKPRPKLEFEALQAYFNRLPEYIEVGWIRDGKFIVGTIKAGEYEFMTQGMNADDFIDMVNDAVITMYDIPERYFDTVKNIHTYNPPIEDIAKLKNTNIQEAFISANKNKQVLEIAKS